MYLCSEIAKRDVTNMELMGMPLWTWVVFYILVFIMLIIDLKMFARKGEHEVNISEALKMTAVWIAVSLLFCAAIYFWYPVDPHGKAMEFLAGYLIEKSLSMDNLFVFLMLFSFFGVERKYQHEVLFWGIFGALVLRSIFIFAGAAMVVRFEWILGLFGLFLVYTGIKMFGHDDDEQVDPANNIFVRLFKRFFPVTDQMHGDKFFIRSAERTQHSHHSSLFTHHLRPPRCSSPSSSSRPQTWLSPSTPYPPSSASAATRSSCSHRTFSPFSAYAPFTSHWPPSLSTSAI